MIRRICEAVGAATLATGAVYAYARLKPYLPTDAYARAVWDAERAHLGACVIETGHPPDRRPDSVIVSEGATTACYLDWTCSCGRTHRFYHDEATDAAPALVGTVATPGGER